MSATLYPILARARDIEIQVGQLDDFELGPAAKCDVDLVTTDPGWSPYCFDFDRGEAVFVRLPDTHDLSSAPFMGIHQFNEATHALTMGLHAFVDLSHTLADPDRVILVFGMGRCGTTLAQAALNRVPGILSLSEPDVFSDLVMSREACPPEHVVPLMQAATRFLFAPLNRKGAATLAIKFRSQSLFDAQDLHAALPDAAKIFMYRNAHSWALSFFRMIQAVGGPMELDIVSRDFIWNILSAGQDLEYLAPYTQLDAPHLEEVLAAGWVLHVETYLRLHQGGMPFLAMSYDELNAGPDAAIAAILAHAGLNPDDAHFAGPAFETDSQKNSPLARRESRPTFTEQAYARLKKALSTQPLPGDITLPDCRTA